MKDSGFQELSVREAEEVNGQDIIGFVYYVKS